MPKRSTILSALLIPAAFCAGLWLRWTRPWETPTQRAYWLCSECGLEVDQIDRLIDDMKHSTLARDQNLELFYGTFDDGDPDPELCKPCVDAVLDAAGARSRAR